MAVNDESPSCVHLKRPLLFKCFCISIPLVLFMKSNSTCVPTRTSHGAIPRSGFYVEASILCNFLMVLPFLSGHLYFYLISSLHDLWFASSVLGNPLCCRPTVIKPAVIRAQSLLSTYIHSVLLHISYPMHLSSKITSSILVADLSLRILLY